MSEIRHAIGKVDFNTAYDFLRAAAVEMVERGEIDRAVNSLQEIDALITRNGAEEEDRPLLDIHAALMQILTALYIEKDDLEAATAPTRSWPRRRDARTSLSWPYSAPCSMT